MASTTLLIGLGKGGSALLPYLLASPDFDLVGVCDSSHEAVGIALAQHLKLPFYDDAVEAVKDILPQIVIDATGDPSLPSTLYEKRPAGTSVVTGEASRLLWEMLSAVEGRRRSELRYNRLISDMRSGLVVVQGDKVRFANKAFLNMVGRAADEVLGIHYGELLDTEVRERDLSLHRARVAGEKAKEEYETRFRHKDGSVLAVLVRARLSDWDGRPASLAILTDVTQLRELQRERERFFRFMIHELRAPLSPLVTAAPLLRRAEILEDPNRLEGLHKLVARSVDRLRGFIDDFLELSKLDQETLTIHQEELDLREIVDEVVDSQSLLAEDKGLDLVLEPWTPFSVLGDRCAVRTMVQNLVNNAIKYTEKGSVRISVAKEDGKFTLSVADTGAGLTEEERKNLFQEFGRIQRMAGVKGSGLGLALVKQLVDACDGRIRVESEGKDKGSVFSIELPCVFGTARPEDK